MAFTNPLHTLILPTGASSGQRIVLNGDQGNIQIFDSANNLVVLIDPVGFIEIFDSATGNQIATMDDLGFTSFRTGLRNARLRDSGLLIFDTAGSTVGQLDDLTGLQLTALDILIDGQSLPRGKIGYAEITANSNTNTTDPFDITGLSVSVPVVNGRSYKITCHYHGVRSTVAGDDVQVYIVADGTQLTGSGRQDVPVANSACNGGTITANYRPGATGNKTCKIQAGRVAGTGSVGLSGGTTLITFILVEDMGVV